jgi:phospholipase C
MAAGRPAGEPMSPRHRAGTHERGRRAATAALLLLASCAAQREDSAATETPIKHVIVLIGENRSFDHVFGLYRPRTGETIRNLLSEGVIDAQGAPGPNFARAAQFAAAPQLHYAIAAPAKTSYRTLPPPDLAGTPTAPSDKAPPFSSVAAVAAIEPALDPADRVLLTTGASALAARRGPDTRIADHDHLPNGPFRLTGPALPYDSYTGDTPHRFFQMWQQSDCDAKEATAANPSGCLSDLYPFIAGIFSRRPNGNAMAFLDMNAGDAPFLKELADTYTISDNFHQPLMGGTGANHQMLGLGDTLFWSDGRGTPIPPPAPLIANPEPPPGGSDYTVDGNWTNCADPGEPGVAPILAYLAAKGLRSNCAADHFYMINNAFPAFLPNGGMRSGGVFAPPSTVRTIGDALNEKGISFAYYAGGFAAAVRAADGSTDPIDAIAAVYCQTCNFLQYTSAIMSDPAERRAHLKDITDLVDDLAAGTLPAVSFAKPDGFTDGHPASSKLGLFEAVARRILRQLDARPTLARDTAVFILFDEGGGYYDSGYIQPLDFFGDGPRVPFLVVSRFARGGHVGHSYGDHVSILKFIERNWHLAPLTARSRDNLPNPVPRADNPYAPRNSPAIGDLFDLFDFASRGG